MNGQGHGRSVNGYFGTKMSRQIKKVHHIFHSHRNNGSFFLRGTWTSWPWRAKWRHLLMKFSLIRLVKTVNVKSTKKWSGIEGCDRLLCCKRSAEEKSVAVTTVEQMAHQSIVVVTFLPGRWTNRNGGQQKRSYSQKNSLNSLNFLRNGERNLHCTCHLCGT